MRSELADNQFIVSQYGVQMKRSSPPSGLGPFSLGDISPLAYIDVYRRIRYPSRPEMVAQLRNSAYVCANLNANGVAQTPHKLYVQTSAGDPRPKCRVRQLSNKQQAWLRGERRGNVVKSSSGISGRISGDADVEEVMDHPYLDLIAKPNPYHSCTDLMRLTSIYLDVVGTNYWWIGNKNRLGIPTEIWPIPAHLCYPWREMPESRELISYWLLTAGRFQVKIPVDEIVDFKWTDLWEPYSRGQSPLVAVWEHVGVNEKMIGHTQNMLDNQARPDAVLTPENMIGEYERERLERRFNAKMRGGGWGGVLVTDDAMKLQPLSWSPVDLATLDVHGVTKDMIADAHGVPQALLTKETNLANLQAARSQHAELGIWPRLILRDETINRLLIPLYDDSGRLFVASDNPVPEDEAMSTKNRQVAVQTGWKTRDEARTEEGMDSQEWAKKPTLPTAHQVLDDSGKPIPPPVKPGQGPGGNGASNGQGKKPKKDKKKKRKKSDTDAKWKLTIDEGIRGSDIFGDSFQGGNSFSRGVYSPDRISDCIRLTEAVQEGKMSLGLARDMVAKCWGEDTAILFEEGLHANGRMSTGGSTRNGVHRNVATATTNMGAGGNSTSLYLSGDKPQAGQAETKDIDITDPMAQRAIDRLYGLPCLEPGDPDDKVPVPFPVDEPGYGVGTVLSDEEWRTQPMATFVLRELCATQPSVRRAEVLALIIEGEIDPQDDRVAHIVRYAEKPDSEKSELYIDNGHHHLTAQWLLGRAEVTARYLDLTKGREAVVTAPVDAVEQPASTPGPEKSVSTNGGDISQVSS